MSSPQQKGRIAKGTLAAIVGLAAATSLLTTIPREESGRTVKVAMDDSGTARITHVSGKQYLRAYLDIAGVPTACDGITQGVRMGQTYTEAQCTMMLERELIVHAQGVMACTPSLARADRTGPRVAAVSLAYNIGVNAWCGSSARRRFEAGDMRGGCEAITLWNKARVGGTLRPVAGLTARRARERAICLKGV